MSLSRTALRLATLEALRPTAELTAATPAWPTLAGKHVFDSGIDPIDDLAPQERRPIIAVYTEADDGTGGQRAGGPPFHRHADLILELAIVALVPVQVEDEVQYFPDAPVTDAQLEASLDLLEAQARFVLFAGPTGDLWRKLTGRKVTKIASVPRRTGEEAARLAMRTLTLTTWIPDDCIEPAPAIAPTGLARLPIHLRMVVEALTVLDPAGYGAKLGAGLAPAAPVMPTAVPFEAVGLEIASIDPPAADAEPRVHAEVEVPQE